MYFYAKMRWELKGMSFQQLWELEGTEARAAIQTIESGMARHLYKVAAEQCLIVIASLPTAEEFDRTAMGRLPMREYLVFEEVFSLEEGFSIDVQGYLGPRRQRLATQPKLLYYVQMAWEPRTRQVDEIWKESCDALRELDAPKVLSWYRVAGQQRAIAIVDAENASELNLLARQHVLRLPNVEKLMSLRDYHIFAQDVWAGFNV